MKEYSTPQIRNIALAGQRGSGKTSLGDAIAFNTGVNSRIGKVDDGSSILDHTDTDHTKKTTVSSKLLACEYDKTKLNFIDCPGHLDFLGDLKAAAYVCESVGFLIGSTAGVEVGTRLQWKSLEGTPGARFFFVNKMEVENANWRMALDSIRTAFGKQAAAVQLPIGQGPEFKGIVDLLHMKAYTYDDSGNRTETEVPGDMKDQVNAEREHLIEVAAEADDSLIEKYFDEGTLSDDDIRKGLQRGINSGTVFPVLFGAAQKNAGVKVLLDFAAEYLPAPDVIKTRKALKSDGKTEAEVTVDPNGKPITYVFKTASEGHLGDMSYIKVFSGEIKPGGELRNQQTNATERATQLYTFQGKNRVDASNAPAGDIAALVKLKDTHVGNTLSDNSADIIIPEVEYPSPVQDVAIRPKTKGDEEKMAAGIHKLNQEDPTFRFVNDAALHQQVLYAQGPTQIEVITDKLAKRFGVEVELVRPKIPYRETIRAKTEKQYRHKKQSGGRGQFADVHLRLEPNERGGGFEFLDEIKGGVIPGKFIPAVEKGVVEAMVSGPLSGSQVVDVKTAVFYGSYHEVDSSDMAFKIAALMAFKEGFMECKPVLLEPIFNLTITVPDDFTGDVMGDVSSRRGKIAGMDPEGPNQVIRAQVPQAELYQYAVDLRSMTQGQGVYSLEFSHYEEVPHDAAQKVIEEYKREREAEHA